MSIDRELQKMSEARGLIRGFLSAFQLINRTSTEHPFGALYPVAKPNRSLEESIKSYSVSNLKEVDSVSLFPVSPPWNELAVSLQRWMFRFLGNRDINIEFGANDPLLFGNVEYQQEQSQRWATKIVEAFEGTEVYKIDWQLKYRSNGEVCPKFDYWSTYLIVGIQQNWLLRLESKY